ncbi:transposase, putative [Acetonema longum DSM 6540]|uniref:Transposase, putative n=1 Tax=Acetonema longum DSM 6540 TaxID=1009370 RepID=F7NQH1_9FIRM|nr:transposase, putative [Acetonema longum DSM 6540]
MDYEYRRCGVAGLFVVFEPLAAKRVVKVTERRTAIDFAQFLKELVDVHYAHVETIVLVMDNLNIHGIASLYKAFEPKEARRIAEKLEIHHTPIPASWLNMAEIEIGVLSRQCLAQSMNTIETMRRKVSAWQMPQKRCLLDCELAIHLRRCHVLSSKNSILLFLLPDFIEH